MIANIQVDYDHIQLNKILSDADIPYVILKGNSSAWYYPDPMLRSMGDVDFLISKKSIIKVDSLLRENDYIAQPLYHECERVYHRGSSVLELHWDINGIPGGKVGKKLNEYLNDIIVSANAALSVNGEFMMPTDFNHGSVMLLHVARHLTTSGIGLRHLCDWAVFVEHVGNKFSDMFEEKLKRVGLWRFAQLMTQLSVSYLGVTSQDWIGELEQELMGQLINDIFSAGNFGVKEKKT